MNCVCCVQCVQCAPNVILLELQMCFACRLNTRRKIVAKICICKNESFLLEWLLLLAIVNWKKTPLGIQIIPAASLDIKRKYLTSFLLWKKPKTKTKRTSAYVVRCIICWQCTSAMNSPYVYVDCAADWVQPSRSRHYGISINRTSWKMD